MKKDTVGVEELIGAKKQTMGEMKSCISYQPVRGQPCLPLRHIRLTYSIFE
jgi:hypothetical protein